METLKLKMCSVAVFRTAAASPLIKSLEKLIDGAKNGEEATLSAAAEVFARLAADGRVENLAAEIFGLLRADENPLSKSCLNGIKPQKEIAQRAEKEYGYFCELAGLSPEKLKLNLPAQVSDCLPSWKAGKMPAFSALVSSYKNNGCGIFAQSSAFIWDEYKKVMRPVEHINPVKMTELKDYAEEKEQISANTEAFIKNLPANNILLYGDRGTGKSSTVHAVLNKFASAGLKLLEVRKSAIIDFPVIIPLLNKVNLKFIIFIDDLSFSADDANYTALKAALEGSITKSKNVLVYATSNRRHLVRENLSDREGDDIHVYDTIEEQMSLSDRFGIVISFVNPEKDGFLSILRQILSDRKISVDDTGLMHLAERYAVKKGGRSPRAAKQLADIIEAAEKLGKEVEI